MKERLHSANTKKERAIFDGILGIEIKIKRKEKANT